MNEIKVGDEVYLNRNGLIGSTEHEGKYKVSCLKDGDIYLFDKGDSRGSGGHIYGCGCGGGHKWVVNNKNYSLVKSSNTKNMFNKFKNLFITEPVKSYRSLGITDGNDKPTQEGIELFVSWALNNPTINEKFIADVVTPLNAAAEAESKK